ncbi:MAG: hypothetical protein LBI73_13530, partial [Myroides sp.]|nr:hypothetical protein [Myroides sp.]
MKKKITTLFLLALGATMYAQDGPGIGIGTPLPLESVMLQVNATNKGILIPQVALASLNDFQLEGKKPVEGVLVYNTNAVGKDGDAVFIQKGFHYWSEVTKKWELISGESQLKTVIEKTETKLTEQIKEITEIKVPGETNLSYLVAFEPKDPTAATTTGKLTYLVPEKDDKGKTVYSKKGISFEELVQGQETKTFFREIMGKVKDKDGKEVDAIVAYEYFNEEVIIEFIKDNPTIKEEDLKDPVKGLKPGTGYKIDIVGVVSNTVKEIFEKENTIKEITNIIDNAKGVMHVKLDVTTQNPT